MTAPSDWQQLHTLAEQVVRHIAAGTGFTTVATIGIGSDGVPVVSRTGFTPVELSSTYGRLLDAVARRERTHPRDAPVYACALVLPERDVAYLHHPQSGAGLAQVLTVGRNPVDDPATRVEVSAGLADWMAALVDTAPVYRPAGRAFLHQPGARLVDLPDPPPGRPPGYHGRHR